MTRNDLLQPLQIGKNAEALADWEVVPGYIDGQHAATAVIKGSEVHFGLVPEFRHRITRRRVREFLEPLLERHGFLTTRILLLSQDKRRFVERVGFMPTWNDGKFQYYLLGDLPWR